MSVNAIFRQLSRHYEADDYSHQIFWLKNADDVDTGDSTPSESGEDDAMVSVETIQKAIAAHTNWKARLREATITGKFDLAPSAVGVDDRCDFGKWLYGADLLADDKRSDHYCTVQRLHAEFHVQAAKVVEWATTGEKDKAEKSLGLEGAYGKASRLLTEAMVRWRQSLQ